MVSNLHAAIVKIVTGGKEEDWFVVKVQAFVVKVQ